MYFNNMKKESIIKDKTYAFAIRIIKLSTFLIEEKKEYIISKQLLRSGTSVGALIREAEYAQSAADFVHKFHISLKEANETEYWLNLLRDTDYLNEALFLSLEQDIKEILRLLIVSIKTAKNNSIKN